MAAVGRRDQLQGLLLRDDMAPTAPGKAKVRFLDAAFDLPAVDIAVAGGPVLASRLAYPDPTRYRQVDSGRQRVEVRRAGAGAVLVKGTVAVKPGTVTSVVLLGGAGEPRELYAFSDAAGSRAAPAGGIRTGAGGTAPSSRAQPAPVLLLAAVLVVVALAAGAARRQPGPSPVPARPRRPALAALAVAALVVVLGGCAGAVDNQEHPTSAFGYAPPPGDPTPRGRVRMPGVRRMAMPDDPGAGSRPTRRSGTSTPPGLLRARPGSRLATCPGGRRPLGRGAPPVRLVIPAIGVATRLVRLGLEPEAACRSRRDFGRAGWFAGGPAPGQAGAGGDRRAC